jgi:curli biogenesis system outer membrane secretion channel CsgG
MTARPAAATFAAAALLAAALSACSSGSGQGAAASASAASARASRSSLAAVQSQIAREVASQSAAANPAPATPTTVTFIVKGSAPDGIDITYGPSGSNFAGPSVLDGTARMSVKFDPGAEYYSMNAQLQGAGDITCKIVVSGPEDAPLTVSKGAARGGYNICDVQAAPADSTGLSWQSEN